MFEIVRCISWKAHYIEEGKNRKQSRVTRMGSGHYATWAVPSDDFSLFFVVVERKEIAKTISTENLQTCADIKFHNMSAYRVPCAHWLNTLATGIGNHNVSLYCMDSLLSVCIRHSHTSQSDRNAFFFLAQNRLRTRPSRNYTSADSIRGGVRGLKSECSFGLTSAFTSCSKRQLSMLEIYSSMNYTCDMTAMPSAVEQMNADIESTYTRKKHTRDSKIEKRKKIGCQLKGITQQQRGRQQNTKKRQCGMCSETKAPKFQ